MAKYTIEECCGCTLIFGKMPLNFFAKARTSNQNPQVIDQDLARMAGATAAWGTVENIKRAKLHYRDFAMKNVLNDPVAKHFDRPAQEWMAFGEYGQASMDLFFAIYPDFRLPDGRSKNGFSYPYEASSFARCRKLIEQVPKVRENFKSVMGNGNYGPVWEELVKNWDRLCEVMDEESPHWRSDESGSLFGLSEDALSKTSALISKIVADARS